MDIGDDITKTPYYVGPAESSTEDTDADFFDAFELPPPEYKPPSPPEKSEDGVYTFRCYNCGYNIGDCNADFCLNCGMMSECAINTNYRQCNNCNSYYLTSCDIFFCNRCGNSLENMADEISCLCGYTNDKDAENCENCGYPLVFYKYNELFGNHGHITDKRTRYCSKCGLYLVPDTSSEPVLLSPGSEMCVICLDKRREVAFLPCGHRCVCEGCAHSYIDEICPLCRYPYKDISKIYL